MKEIDKKWEVYIKHCLKRGQSLIQIKEDLIQRNYPIQVVDKVLKKYTQRKIIKNQIFLILFALVIVSFVLIKPTITGFTILNNEQIYPTTININYSIDVGIVNDRFYGINTHGNWGKQGYSNDVGTSNYAWHREKFLESGTRFQRWDAGLQYASDIGGKDMSAANELLNWSSQNGITVVYVLSYIPPWLANTSANCATKNWTCPPNNWTQWDALVLNTIGNLTNNGEFTNIEIEIWNEPDLAGFWEVDQADRDLAAQDYVYLYNHTYWLIKNTYPDMRIGGPAVSNIASSAGLAILDAFLPTYCNQTDFISFHDYRPSTSADADSYYPLLVNAMKDNLTYYNCDVQDIYLDEVNERDWSVMNDGTEYEKQTALLYLGLLNDNSSNIRINLYEWQMDNTRNIDRIFSMLDEPNLGDKLYASYNVTKDFSTYHSAGSTVVFTNSSETNILALTTKTADQTFLTVINKNSIPTNVSVSIQGYNLSIVNEISSGTNYSITNNSFIIENIEPFGVEHYELFNTTINETINETNETTNNPPTITVSLSQTLNCSTNTSDIEDDIITTTIEWYYNNTLNKTVNASSDIQNNWTGEHYCKAIAYDNQNYSNWVTSNTINITTIEIIIEPPEEKTSSPGSGGRMPAASAVNVTVENITEPVPEVVEIINETILKVHENDTLTVIENKTIIQIEQPTILVKKTNLIPYVLGLIIILIIASIIFIKIMPLKPTEHNPELLDYIKKSLDYGYDYDAIERVLSKHYNKSFINHHFKALKKSNIQPSKTIKASKPFTAEIQKYIEKQKTAGYKDEEIMKVLKLQGYLNK